MCSPQDRTMNVSTNVDSCSMLRKSRHSDAPVRWRDRPNTAIAARKASSSDDATRYEVSTRTGPSSGSGSKISVGSGQCEDGVRSRLLVFACSGHHVEDSPHSTNSAALTSRLVELLVAPASTPHATEPTACPPMKTSWYTDNPRARTHAGRLSCIEALSVDSDSNQDAPPMTKAPNTTAKIGTNASTAVATAKPAAPTVSKAFWPNRARSRDNRNAPSTAPAPRAPSSNP